MSGLDSVAVALALHAAVATSPGAAGFTTPAFLQRLSCVTAGYDEIYGEAWDGRSALYVCDWASQQVMKFDAAGNRVLQWGCPAELGFWSPHGVTVSTAGEVYVTDNFFGRVVVFSESGAYRRVLGDAGQPPYFFRPTYLFATPEGTVLVSDSENKQIQEIAPDGAVVRIIGSLGTGPGQLGGPRGVAMDAAGRIYVADEGNRRVTVYSRTGTYLQTWPIPTGFQVYFTPVVRGIRVDDLGRIHVTDRSNSRVIVFAPDGTVVGEWGTKGTEPGELWGPNNIEFDDRGRIYIGESDCAVQVFGRDGATVPRRSTWGAVKLMYR